MVPHKPTNDTDRRILAKQILATASRDRRAQAALVPAEQFVHFETTAVAFCEALTHAQKQQAIYSGTVEAKNRALPELALYVRHFTTALKRRARRMNYPAQILEYYRLRDRKHMPHNNLSRKWLDMAEDLIRGEAQVTALGYEPIMDPTVAELSEKLARARAACAAFSEAERELWAAQRELKALRIHLDRGFGFMWKLLAYYLESQGKQETGVRNGARRYGFQFPVTGRRFSRAEAQIPRVNDMMKLEE